MQVALDPDVSSVCETMEETQSRHRFWLIFFSNLQSTYWVPGPGLGIKHSWEENKQQQKKHNATYKELQISLFRDLGFLTHLL